MILHPFFFLGYGLLGLYAANIAQIPPQHLFLGLFVGGLTLCILRVVLGRLVFRNPQTEALWTSLLVGLFFSYSQIRLLIVEILPDNDWARHRNLFILAGTLLLVAFVLLFRTQRSFLNLNKICNVVGCVLFFFPIYSVGAYHVTKYLESGELRSVPPPVLSAEEKLSSLGPNIYHIILDAYAGKQSLIKYYGYDNSNFYTELRKRGFQVPETTYSNYPLTHLSLSSMLNMDYIQNTTVLTEDNSQNAFKLTYKIRNSRTVSILRELGYQFINISSGWDATDYIAAADRNIQCGLVWNEYLVTILKTTMLYPMMKVAIALHLPIAKLISVDMRELILCQFEQLAENQSGTWINRGRFVLAHIMSPHPPNIFGPNGEVLEQPDLEYHGNSIWQNKQAYLGQLIFTSKLVLKTIDRILDRDPDAVIIINSDHGSMSAFPSDDSPFLHNPTENMVRERFDALLAMRMPGHQYDSEFEVGMSLVNSYRLLFRDVFNFEMKLISDHYYYSWEPRPYDLISVDHYLKGDFKQDEAFE